MRKLKIAAKKQQNAENNPQSLFFRGKKAVSPLIATVLLIAFAVALGAVVMNWGRGYVEDTADFAKKTSDREITCSTDISLEIIKIGGRKQICLDNGTNTINFTVQNSGSIQVVGIKIQAIGNTSSIASKEINETFDTATPKRIKMNYSYVGNGTVSQVRITPLIEIEESKVWCAQNVLKIEGVGLC